ncbi:MAG TPA: nicotinate-nucleotide--dimethylbenzimidazole phosphoribosyltransferase [Methylovirgula sp.]|nr:nicotinate-nucleotide--dimethylbenzimidazole phosphoribosyltransferase [Methylovirgula sp.]
MTSPTLAPPQSFDDIRALLSKLPPPAEDCAAAAHARQAELTKPAGSLGRLEEIVEFLAAWQGRAMPSLARARVLVFAGNHGVVERGVSAYPASVTAAMAANFAAGGAAINQICATFNLDLNVVALDLDQPTLDFTEGAAMSETAAVASFARGMAAVPDGADLVAIGEMGIGNTTSAAAIYSALYDGKAGHWTGRGSGLDEPGLARKVAAIEAAVRLHRDKLGDPFEVLRRLGGYEIAAMAGAIVAARVKRAPVLLDGYVAGAAAAILHAQDPTVIAHCLAAHVAAEGAHADVLQRLGKRPLLDLDMRLGEASGAALAAGLVKAALACHRDMATFAEASVAGKLES